MKFDHDCARLILLTIEEQLPYNRYCTITDLSKTKNLQEFSLPVIWYATQTLTDGGFLHAENLKANPLGDVSRIKGITFTGHEYLDNIRDQSVWTDTKKTIFSKLSSASLSVFSSVAAKVILDKLGL